MDINQKQENKQTIRCIDKILLKFDPLIFTIKLEIEEWQAWFKAQKFNHVWEYRLNSNSLLNVKAFSEGLVVSKHLDAFFYEPKWRCMQLYLYTVYQTIN